MTRELRHCARSSSALPRRQSGLPMGASCRRTRGCPRGPKRFHGQRMYARRDSTSPSGTCERKMFGTTLMVREKRETYGTEVIAVFRVERLVAFYPCMSWGHAHLRVRIRRKCSDLRMLHGLAHSDGRYGHSQCRPPAQLCASRCASSPMETCVAGSPSISAGARP